MMVICQRVKRAPTAVHDAVSHRRKAHGQKIADFGYLAPEPRIPSCHFCSALWATNSLPVRALRIMEISQY
jgi:hypothetical protein